MDFDNSKSDRSSWDATVLELAGHPLSSINPSPEDLPDLLDKAITNETELRKRLERCETTSECLGRQIISLKERLDNTRGELSRRSEAANGYRVRNPKRQSRSALEAHDTVLTRMLFQTVFMQHCLSETFRGLLQHHIKSHKEIFDTFLGERHDHPGIEIASSEFLYCVEGCDWYFIHGPYEWTKKPYSNVWREEMNSTDWDWFRVRQHIEEVLEDTKSKALDVVDLFHAHVKRFVPYWFHAESLQSWTLLSGVQKVRDPSGLVKVKNVVVARFSKSESAIKEEKHRKLEELNKGRMTKEGLTGAITVEDTDVAVDPVGMQLIDPNIVFDGIASAPDWDDGAHPKSLGSWLNYWGYHGWHQKYSANKSTNQKT